MIVTVVFGLLVLGLGAALLVACANQTLASVLNANRIYENWKAMLVQGPSGNPVVGADVCSYQARSTPRHGYYFIDRGETIGSASRVHVPLDLVARLPFNDRWTDRRLHSTSLFALRTDDAGDVTEFIARGRRYCLTLDDDSILARDGYPLNCQLAVHWYVDLPLDKTAEWDRLFDDLPHVYDLIRDTAAGFLRNELTRRNYRDAMYDAPAVLKSLQACWESSPETARYRPLVHVAYTGLAIMPREEAERKVLDRLERGKARLQEQIDAIRKEIDGTFAVLQAEWMSIDGARAGGMNGLRDQVPNAVRSQAESVGEIIVKQQTYDEAIAQSERVFDSAQTDLAKYAENLTNAFSELGRFIRELDRRNKQLLLGPSRLAGVEQPEAKV